MKLKCLLNLHNWEYLEKLKVKIHNETTSGTITCNEKWRKCRDCKKLQWASSKVYRWTTYNNKKEVN